MKTNISGFDIEGTPAEIYEFIQLGLKTTSKETEIKTIKPRKNHQEETQIDTRQKREYKTPIRLFAVSPTGEEMVFGSMNKAAKYIGTSICTLSKNIKKYNEFRINGWSLKLFNGEIGDVKYIDDDRANFKTNCIKVVLSDTKGNSSVCQSIRDCTRRTGLDYFLIRSSLADKGFYKDNTWLIKPYTRTTSNQL